MEYRGIKVNYVIIIVIIALIIYFTGNFIINRYNIEKPLLSEIVDIEGIKNCQLEESNGITKLIITLNNSADLYQIYHEVNNKATEKLGNDKYTIKINNKENKNLQNVYFKAHYAIFEGIATKKFTAMNENIENIAQENNLMDYKLWIDNQNIYLKLADRETVLYRIISRTGDDRGGENVG